MAIENLELENADGIMEPVSREAFFARTTPGHRMLIDRCQSEAGEASLYQSADEWAEDLVASYIATGVPEAAARQFAAEDSRHWRANYGQP